MNALFQLISEAEIPTLLRMMKEFYSQRQMLFDGGAAARTIKQALADPSLGQIFFIFRGNELAGYFALTFCFSLEFHGTFGLLDEIYISERFRAQKLGTAVMTFAETVCKQRGIKALRLEVGRANLAAQGLYRRSGLVEDARFLYTKWL